MNTYCGNCGRENLEDSNACAGCGMAVGSNKPAKEKISGGVFGNDGRACNFMGIVSISFVALLSAISVIMVFVSLALGRPVAVYGIASFYVLAMLFCVSFLKMLLAKIDSKPIKMLSYISIIVIFATALILGILAVITAVTTAG
ncbi:MAG: hypothetical protein FWC11_00880 [Firmicutes bacterium]|nr:hypothetical protein [Bacillota bacterium]MCL2255396.1 hypothetical protein [Bacillota bacterium]